METEFDESLYQDIYNKIYFSLKHSHPIRVNKAKSILNHLINDLKLTKVDLLIMFSIKS